MIRRRNLWCGVRSSVMCSLPRVHVTHPYRMVSITLAVSMRNFRANGAASISYSSRFATLVPASQMYELYIYTYIYIYIIAVSAAVPVRRRIRSEYVCMRSKPSPMKRQSGLEAQCVPYFVGTIQAIFLASNFPNLSGLYSKPLHFFSVTFWYTSYILFWGAADWIASRNILNKRLRKRRKNEIEPETSTPRDESRCGVQYSPSCT